MHVMEAFRIDGKVAVVIGGTGVLCSVMAEALAAAGAGVVVVGRDAHRGDAVAQRIGRVGEARFEQCDLTRRSEIGELVDRVLDTAPEGRHLGDGERCVRHGRSQA